MSIYFLQSRVLGRNYGGGDSSPGIWKRSSLCRKAGKPVVFLSCSCRAWFLQGSLQNNLKTVYFTQECNEAVPKCHILGQVHVPEFFCLFLSKALDKGGRKVVISSSLRFFQKLRFFKPALFSNRRFFGRGNVLWQYREGESAETLRVSAWSFSTKNSTGKSCKIFPCSQLNRGSG